MSQGGRDVGEHRRRRWLLGDEPRAPTSLFTSEKCHRSVGITIGPLLVAERRPPPIAVSLFPGIPGRLKPLPLHLACRRGHPVAFAREPPRRGGELQVEVLRERAALIEASL